MNIDVENQEADLASELYTDLEVEEQDAAEEVIREPSVAEMLADRDIVSLTLNVGNGLMASTIIGGITDLAPDEYGMIQVFAPYLVQFTDNGLAFQPLVNFSIGWMNQVSRHSVVACGDVHPKHMSLYMDLIANLAAAGTQSVKDTQSGTVH